MGSESSWPHNKKYKKILQEELGSLKKQMEEQDPLPSNLLGRKTFVQSEFMKLAEEEELYWHKWSNVNWLLRGDNNTNFFHRIANGKKIKNTIFSLQHDDGNIEGDAHLLEHSTNYYKSTKTSLGPALAQTLKWTQTVGPLVKWWMHTRINKWLAPFRRKR